MATPNHDRDNGFAGRLSRAVQRSAFDRFGFAVLVTVAAGIVQAILIPLGMNDLTSAVYLLAVLVTALFAGFGPAVVSAGLGIALGSVNEHLWIAGRSFGLGDVVAYALRLAAGIAVAWATESLLRKERQSALRSDEMQARADELESTTRSLQGRMLEIATRESKLRSTLETLPDSLLVVDEAGTIQGSSPLAERVFGWSAEEMMGQSFALLLSDGKRSDYAARRQQLVEIPQGSRPVQWFGLYGRHIEGRVFPIAIAIAELPTEASRQFVYLVRDESGRKSSIERLAQVQAKIAHMTRLAALSEMGGTLAHQLNQPLAAISNYVNAARRLGASIDGPGASEFRAALIRASEQSLRAGTIISQAREAVAGGLGERTPESLRDLVEEAIGVALLVENESDIEIGLNLASDMDAVLVDRILVQHVIVSLIRNALAGMTNCPRRELAISSAAGQGNMVQVSVADPGTYIPTGALLHAFYPFAAIESNETGNGLSVVRSIVQSHGGEVLVTSNHTGGSTFTFTLPRAEA